MKDHEIRDLINAITAKLRPLLPNYQPLRETIANATTEFLAALKQPEDRANSKLYAALKDIIDGGDLDDNGNCRYCGRHYSKADAQEWPQCGADECPGTIARAALARFNRLPSRGRKGAANVPIHSRTRK
jgi:hypothetical protein